MTDGKNVKFSWSGAKPAADEEGKTAHRDMLHAFGQNPETEVTLMERDAWLTCSIRLRQGDAEILVDARQLRDILEWATDMEWWGT